jgi:hypothetical protein
MANEWKVGDRVASVPENAWLWGNSPWGKKLALERRGTVVEVPLAVRTVRIGTLRVEWDSLSGEKADPEAWRMWVHSSLIERAREIVE